MNAAGEDGSGGAADHYEVRYSGSPITDENFGEATLATGTALPSLEAGTLMDFSVQDLWPGSTYYFAVRAFDAANTSSPVTAIGPLTMGNALIADNVEGAEKWDGDGFTLRNDSDTGNHYWGMDEETTHSSGYNYLTYKQQIHTTGPTIFKFRTNYDLEWNYDTFKIEASNDGGTTWKAADPIIDSSNENWVTKYSVIQTTGDLKIRIKSGTINYIFLDDITLLKADYLFFDDVEGAAKFNADFPWIAASSANPADSVSPTHVWADSVGAFPAFTDAKLTSKTELPGSNYCNLVARFYWRGNLQDNASYAEYSTDSGANWIRYFKDWRTFPTYYWEENISMPELTGKNFFFRHRTASGANKKAYGIDLDDISWTGEPFETVPAVSGLSADPNPIAGGNGSLSTGTVTLDRNALAGGQLVQLSSSRPDIASVPSSVTVPAGSSAVDFIITTSSVATVQNVSITASSLGYTKTVALIVAPLAPSNLTLSQSTVVGGRDINVNATLTLNGAAPIGGAQVSLSSSDASAATVPATVLVPAGSKTATFKVSHLFVASTRTTDIKASYGGTDKSVTLEVRHFALESLTLDKGEIPIGSSTNARVILSANAPTGGSVVRLSTNLSGMVDMPASVTIAAGKKNADFTITCRPDLTATSTIKIKAALNEVILSSNLKLVSLRPTALTISPTSGLGGTAKPKATVTISSPAPTGGIDIALASNRAQLTVPSTVRVKAGQTTATFNVITGPVDAENTGKITASYGGKSVSADFKLTPAVFKTFKIAPTSAIGGTGSPDATVTLDGKVVKDTVVTITTSNSAVAGSTIAKVKVLAGQSTVTWPLFTKPVTAQQTVTFSATVRGVTKTAVLTVKKA